jgi:hypothetical protein
VNAALTMKRPIIWLVMWTAVWPVLTQGSDERPVMKEPQANLLNCIEALARGNVAAARVNVAYDAAQKRVSIFAVSFGNKTAHFKERGYQVAIIYNTNVAAEAKVGVGSYQFQHNNQVLAFAAAEFAAGRKAFGRRLIGFLAKAQPDLFWSSPTHALMTIEEIQAGLGRDDATVRDFLADQRDTWAETLSAYGPSEKRSRVRAKKGPNQNGP